MSNVSPDQSKGVGQEDAPHPLAVASEPQLRALPAVEVAEEVDVLRGGQPLAEPPAVEVAVALPAVVEVAVGVVDDRARRTAYLVHFFLVAAVAPVQLRFDGAQPLVAFDDRQPSVRFSHRFGQFYTNI